MKDRSVEVADLDEATRELAAISEIGGRRTTITRNGVPVAIVVSWDEYFALRETVALGENEELLAELELADAQAGRGQLLLPEDWFVE